MQGLSDRRLVSCGPRGDDSVPRLPSEEQRTTWVTCISSLSLRMKKSDLCGS